MSGTVENTDHFDTCHFGVRCPSVDAKLVSYTVDDTGFTPMTLEIHVPFRCPMTLVLPLLILKFTKKVPNSCHKLVSGSVENTDHFDTDIQCHFGVQCPNVDAELVLDT